MPSLYKMLTLVLTIQMHMFGSYCLPFTAGLKKLRGSQGLLKGHVSGSDLSQEDSTSLLALGEPCGVYTLSCLKGLRCVPSEGEQSPLQALLQGRGICRSIKTKIETPTPTESRPSTSDSSEKGPCRKQLNSILQKIDLTAIQFEKDIYIPNCDKQGFYRKKQCWSSRGTQRGQCWCVDQKGTKIPSSTTDDGSVSCSGV
ncbi:insulin-like growth factor-binding protein 6a [Hoplias malabaricus]|uniref:insulin-like growth factor-binding protein 6a n=1 Tax=Hoplias malabaricus TaxID=27720 RepID=UPI0034618DF6